MDDRIVVSMIEGRAARGCRLDRRNRRQRTVAAAWADFVTSGGRKRVLEGRLRYVQAERVFPGNGAPLIPDGVIAMEAGRITGVGRLADFGGSIASQVDSFPHSTLLPGLVDAHVHVTFPADGRTYEQFTSESDDMMVLVAVRNLRQHLAAGVTTVRDQGARNQSVFHVREAVKRGYFEAPRLLVAGRPLTHSGGHLHWCNGVADGEVEIRAAVRRLINEGADHIKIMASGGATAGNIPYYASYQADELRVAVDAAHALGRLTAAHCRSRDSILNAIDAGVDSIEHAEFLVPGPMERHGRGTAPTGVLSFDETVGERLVRSNAYVSFTLQAGGYKTLVNLREKQSEGEISPPEVEVKDTLEAHFAQKLDLLDRLVGAGTLPKLVISTDAGPYDGLFGELYLGLELAVMAGMTSAQALEAATRVPAEAIGIGKEVGTLEVGKVADMLVVDGDPLADIRAVRRVSAVYLGGNRVDASGW